MQQSSAVAAQWLVPWVTRCACHSGLTGVFMAPQLLHTARHCKHGAWSEKMAFINYVTQIQFDFGAVRLLAQSASAWASPTPWW